MQAVSSIRGTHEHLDILSVDACVADDVSDREIARLLGWPRNRAFDDALAAAVSEARAWYRRSGQPFATSVLVDVESIEVDEVTLTGALRCRSAALAARLRSAGARSVAVVAVTAGRALDDETARLWAADRPDLAFCLDRLGAAVVEHLVRWTAAAVCRRAAGTEGLTALPPLAPGCSGWALSDQAMLFGLFEARESPLRMLDSGMLHPKNSMLAVVGLAAHWPDSPYLAACRACELTPCAYRRVPFDRAREGVWLEAGEGSA